MTSEIQEDFVHNLTRSSKMASWNDEDIGNRLVNDLVHGFVELDAFVWAVIDTPQFQRLRFLKQLGTTSFVWPCASHSRFEHSLGVAHLARKVTRHLRDTQPELEITDRDIRCVQLAGLCHDLGHGPFSHVFDGRFIPMSREKQNKDTRDPRWSHEQMSVMMFDFMLQQNGLEIDEADARFVKALIDGSHKDYPSEKPFLFDIIANKRNGIDVDKFDYILRDTKMFSGSVDVSIEKLIRSMRVSNDQICYNVKDAHQLSELCHKRYFLHKSHYNHKTATAVEFMICDVFLKADRFFKISTIIHDPKRYQFFDDSILRQIAAMEATDTELLEAQELIAKIHKRDLYKCVDYNYVSYDSMATIEKQITADSIVKAARQGPILDRSLSVPSIDNDDIDEAGDEEGDIEDLKPDHIAVDIAPLHHGMKNDDPLTHIQWYSKSKRDLATAQPAPVGVLSSIRLGQHAEVLVRIYVKDVRFFRLVQAGYRKAMEELGPRPISFPFSEPPSTPTRATTPVQQPGPKRIYTPNSFTEAPKTSPRSRRKIRNRRVFPDDDPYSTGSPRTPTLGEKGPLISEGSNSSFESTKTECMSEGSTLLASPSLQRSAPVKRLRDDDPLTSEKSTTKRKKT